MLGLYENFPQYPHKVLQFSILISHKKLQQVIIQTLYKINNESFDLNEVAKPSIPNCIGMFEFGIAESENFNYLDLEETEEILEKVRKKPFQLMDFFCAVKYYKLKGNKSTPLKFDYYMIRLTFNNDVMEIQIFHERGPRHILPEDIINLISRKVNESFSKKALKEI